MKSSDGAHFVALDHVRACAALLVFTWHFIHAREGFPVPFGELPTFFPFALLNEGHTGVALFMTLSGYLFAKLIGQQQLHYAGFLWNRALRLFPLLFLVMLVAGAQHLVNGGRPSDYAAILWQGWVLPTWPNGGWSITVELHFYLLLPLALVLVRRYPSGVGVVIVLLIATRAALHAQAGQVFTGAYFTLLGRADQFLLGMLAAQYAHLFKGRYRLALGIALLWCAVYAVFNAQGGLMRSPGFPSTSAWWIILPTLEALVYGSLIAWYDASHTPSLVGVSKWWARLGQYSYSIYLLHFFYVFALARWIDQHVLDLSNVYVACVFAALCFVASGLLGHLSYRFIESPCLRWRKPYLRPVP